MVFKQLTLFGVNSFAIGEQKKIVLDRWFYSVAHAHKSIFTFD